ncbi:MAG: helix-hairpin-helix domain-containing protein [Planctomycetota bacterium]
MNTASWPELDNLPGIGAGLAQAIIDHREAFGPFRNLEELQQVDGIGPARLSSLLPYLLKPEDREEPLTHGLDSIGISDGD